MDAARNVGPVVGLILGVIAGWFLGRGAVAVQTTHEPAPVSCPVSPLEAQVRGLELEVDMLKAELEEGW
jgi:hypothetical protein